MLPTQPFIVYSEMGKKGISFSDKAQKALKNNPNTSVIVCRALPSLKEKVAVYLIPSSLLLDLSL